jgi:hypothetical protein
MIVAAVIDAHIMRRIVAARFNVSVIAVNPVLLPTETVASTKVKLLQSSGRQNADEGIIFAFCPIRKSNMQPRDEAVWRSSSHPDHPLAAVLACQ